MINKQKKGNEMKDKITNKMKVLIKKLMTVDETHKIWYKVLDDVDRRYNNGSTDMVSYQMVYKQLKTVIRNVG